MTGIGCAYKVCAATNQLTVTCLYNKIGYYTNGVMWENGTACASAGDCTTYPGSSCSGGLCVKELEQTDTGANTMCPSNANMTDASRQKFLDMHNYLRSRAANGLEPDALGGNAPKASQMLKMVYDCAVEASAIKHSQKCVYQHSTSADRPGLGENLYKTTALNVDRVATAAESSQLWWNELKDYGVGPENNLTQALWDRPGMQIGHYTQAMLFGLIWPGIAPTSLAVPFNTAQPSPIQSASMAQRKHTFSFLFPIRTMKYNLNPLNFSGNYMNQLIYTIGNPCTSDAGCPGSYTCSVSEGLCNVV
ncbi:SCP-like protein [Ancylostoma duodenale]|uniref:SCP-like protein n=1 Tax=Ancylostoma duodenale TaxID=51022 RepID=A0A0C2GWN2_9BILA|nr:SCP-like protein [Ancylostoma duodenale]